MKHREGVGLAGAAKRSGCYNRITKSSRLMQGLDFVEGIKIRHNLVNTRERANRDRNVPARTNDM